MVEDRMDDDRRSMSSSCYVEYSCHLLVIFIEGSSCVLSNLLDNSHWRQRDCNHRTTFILIKNIFIYEMILTVV
jgi:hypothetical protein